MSDRPLPHRSYRDAPLQRARERLTAARRRVKGSWIEDVAGRLKELDFLNAIVLFGAALMLSVLPLVILMSSLADQRIDDDLSRHIGLDHGGAHIIQGLFRTSPTHSAGPILLGVTTALAGTVAVVSSLQMIYEGAFRQEHRGWRDLPRFLVWVVALLGLLIAAALYDNPLRDTAGPVVRGLVSFMIVLIFLWWTMHFLLAGRVPWQHLIRAALATAFLWLGLALFSSIYFSSAIISENKLYGTIGVVFILLIWFIAIGAVIVLGATCGAVWQERARRDA